ncbi:hypothetical protein PR048_031163 [Dryococelus australis]|uniref:Transmembrane BAX inhibitor motif-containing protein 4 n=1 Tax=Dryococelus australis TaxID=614101 RepID=A0ABQ9G5M1_9NEOP|nr:hypothetical protein PR048_031163 [Dryococelus australis]
MHTKTAATETPATETPETVVQVTCGDFDGHSGRDSHRRDVRRAWAFQQHVECKTAGDIGSRWCFRSIRDCRHTAYWSAVLEAAHSDTWISLLRVLLSAAVATLCVLSSSPLPACQVPEHLAGVAEMASIPLMMPDDDAETGGKPGIFQDFAYHNNVHQASLHVRMGFLRKVYGLLGVQLLVSTVIAGVCMLQEDVKAFIHSNDWLLFCAFVLSFGFLIALHMKRREFPTNLILLAGFTVVEAYSVGVVLTYFEQAVVLHALLLTLVIVAGLTAFTLQTKRDFSFLGVGLFVGLSMLLMAGLVQMVVGSTALELAISIGGAILFSLFIVVDTQMLMKTLSPEEYIVATITLYLDIINLFLHILRALEAARRQ